MSSERTQEEGRPGHLALSYKFRPVGWCVMSFNPPGSEHCSPKPAPLAKSPAAVLPPIPNQGRPLHPRFWERGEAGGKEGGRETHTDPPSSHSINE